MAAPFKRMTGATLITGADGLLGSALVQYLKQRGDECVAWNRSVWDLESDTDPYELMSSIKPQRVVHCAAWTNVDAAEDNPKRCRRINVDATAQLATAATRLGASFLLVSSGGVFDGKATTPYNEDAEAHPATVYHRSKWEAENRTLEINPLALVTRVGWLFGGQPDQDRNFVAARIRECRNRDQVYADNSQHGTPCWTNHIATRMIDLLAEEISGVVHVANAGLCSRLEYVEAIAQTSGLSTNIIPAPPGHFRRRAAVPANEALVSRRISEVGLPPLPCWRQALNTYVKSNPWLLNPE